MTEAVMEENKIKDTYQMNDYAISKWAGELMCLNSDLKEIKIFNRYEKKTEKSQNYYFIQ
jgi:hypothetical protein